MTRVPRPYYQMPRQTPPPQIPRLRRPRRRRGKFHWQWVTVILTLLGLMWFTSHLKPSFTWSEFMHYIGVKNPDRYTRVAMLCLVGIGVTWTVKILTPPSKEKDDK